jgi:hypothetical protein
MGLPAPFREGASHYLSPRGEAETATAQAHTTEIDDRIRK